MKILVVSGSFKDVFNPLEACDMIRNALDQTKNEIELAPICDGGEYTFEVLKQYFGYREECAGRVLNAYCKEIAAPYLVNGEEAHIVSSEIIRLFPQEDAYKNPLKLTDYGLGQMVRDAVEKGYRKIRLYIGGTSTVGCGMGFAQALGVLLYDKEGCLLDAPVLGGDLDRIHRIDTANAKYKNIQLEVIADGDAKSYEMARITRLKVGQAYEAQKEQIVEASGRGVENVVAVSGLAPDMAFSGAAGGLAFGIEQVFHPEYKMGAVYFADLLGLNQKIQEAELIITGEGRFDNTACGKTPASVASIAKKYGKQVLFVCGQIAKEEFSSYENGMIMGNSRLKALGIDAVITCQDYYDEMPVTGSYEEKIALFREKTPELLAERFRRMQL